MIDSHAHLDFKEFDKDRYDVIKRFFNNGGEKIINVGGDIASSVKSCKIAKGNANIFASVGIHPNNSLDFSDKSLLEMDNLISNDKNKVVAVGEIGLDYFRNKISKRSQEKVFRSQIELAEKHNIPIIIHCRKAFKDLIEILRKYKKSNWRGAIHCFSSDNETAGKLLEMGFYIGFTGIISYYDSNFSLNNSRNKDFPKIYNAVINIPTNRILVETDCPFLSPVPKRNERNEPLFVKYTIEKIAQIKNANVGEIEKATSENAKKLFEISV